eukprot:68214-Chlamydomonas_euryale.AAC.1
MADRGGARVGAAVGCRSAGGRRSFRPRALLPHLGQVRCRLRGKLARGCPSAPGRRAGAGLPGANRTASAAG